MDLPKGKDGEGAANNMSKRVSFRPSMAENNLTALLNATLKSKLNNGNNKLQLMIKIQIKRL